QCHHFQIALIEAGAHPIHSSREYLILRHSYSSSDTTSQEPEGDFCTSWRILPRALFGIVSFSTRIRLCKPLQLVLISMLVTTSDELNCTLIGTPSCLKHLTSSEST